jgi:hypothetical protein
MTGTPRDAVVAWLHGQGFGLEYSVARAFRANGFRATQGLTYRDPETRKLRDVDVHAQALLASVRDTPLPFALPNIAAVVECKRSKAPWLVLTTPDRDFGKQPSVPIATAELRRALDGHPVVMLDTLKRPSPTPFNVLQSHAEPSNDSNPAYAACNQAVSSCIGMIEEGAGHMLAYPVVVTDAPLFSVSYGEDGSEQVDEAEWARVLWSGAPRRTDAARRGDEGRHRKARQDPAVRARRPLPDDRVALGRGSLTARSKPDFRPLDRATLRRSHSGPRWT